MNRILLPLLLTSAVVGQEAYAQEFSYPSTLPPIALSEESNIVLSNRGAPVWLVRVEAVKVTPLEEHQGRFNKIVVKIIHSYTGLSNIVGSTFEVSSVPDSHGIKNLNLKVGEQAIYCVIPPLDSEATPQPPKVTEAPQSGWSSYGNRFPVQQAEATFNSAVAYAEAIEQVARATPDEQKSLFKSYAKGSKPESVWAISTIARSQWDGAPKFLLGLAKEPQTLVAKSLGLEGALRSLEAKGRVQWSDTSPRLKLWRRLVTLPAAYDDGRYILDQLVGVGRTESARHKAAQKEGMTYILPISGERLFEWTRLAANNVQWDPRARGQAISCAKDLHLLGLLSRATTWAYLLSYIKKHPDFDRDATPPSAQKVDVNTTLAESALIALLFIKPLASEETKTLRVLQQGAKSPFFKRMFDKVMQQDPQR